ncbi:MAG: hypothetical protein AAF701_07540, partial [Pseudomonadota bacterium]
MNNNDLLTFEYDLERMVIYHDIRRAFNARINAWTLGLILFLGSGALLTVMQGSPQYTVPVIGWLVKSETLIGIASLVSAGLGFLQLVGRFSEMSARHEIA